MFVSPSLRSSRWTRVSVAVLSFALAGCSSAPTLTGTASTGSGGNPPGVAANGSNPGAGGATAGSGSGNEGSGPVATSGDVSGTASGSTSTGPTDASTTPAAADGGSATSNPSSDGSSPIADGGAPAMHPDLGKGNGSDVVLLGDSWMSNTLQVEGTGGGIAPALQQVAGQPYRNYAVQGVMMLMADSFGPAIPTQWPQAVMANSNIKTVVMTGGGNDIIQNSTLQTNCQQGGTMCQMVMQQIAQAFNTLWTQMADAGVKDVVYVMYARNVGSTAMSLRPDGGLAPYPICTSGRIRCHPVDTTAAVMGQIASDGIHPLAAANQRVAMQIYNLMVSEGMRR